MIIRASCDPASLLHPLCSASGLDCYLQAIKHQALPLPFYPSAPSFLQAIDIEVGFLRRGVEIVELFSSGEITRNFIFIKTFKGIVMSSDQVIVF